MAILFRISALKAGFLLLAAAAMLLAAPTLAQTTRPADKPAQKKDQSAKSGKAKKGPRSIVTRPVGRPSAIRTRRNPDADLAPDPKPPIGQIPTVSGGIPRLNASGFAPNAPVFQGLQPELPEPGPLPVGPGVGLGIGRGSGPGPGDGQGDDDDDNDNDEKANSLALQGCVEESGGVTVWRGSCGD